MVSFKSKIIHTTTTIYINVLVRTCVGGTINSFRSLDSTQANICEGVSFLNYFLL